MIAHDLALAIVRYENIYDAFKPKMSITQFIVMGAIEAGKTHRDASIAEKTGLQQSVVRDVVHKLKAKKLISRVTDKGLRGSGRPITILAAGVQAYEECQAIIVRTDNVFFEAFGSATRSECREFIRRLTLTT